MSCPTCGCTLVSFCPRCRGKVGGSRKSPAKTKAVTQNARRSAIARRRKERKV